MHPTDYQTYTRLLDVQATKYQTRLANDACLVELKLRCLTGLAGASNLHAHPELQAATPCLPLLDSWGPVAPKDAHERWGPWPP